MTNPEESRPAPVDRVQRIRHVLMELSKAHDDQVDETYLEEALRARARTLRGIQETHGTAPLLSQSDHREIIISVINERIRLAKNMYESLIGISPGEVGLFRQPNGQISPGPSDLEKSN